MSKPCWATGDCAPVLLLEECKLKCRVLRRWRAGCTGFLRNLHDTGGLTANGCIILFQYGKEPVSGRQLAELTSWTWIDAHGLIHTNVCNIMKESISYVSSTVLNLNESAHLLCGHFELLDKWLGKYTLSISQTIIYIYMYILYVNVYKYYSIYIYYVWCIIVYYI